MSVRVIKTGNPAKKEPALPPPELPMVGICYGCTAEWECVGCDIQRATVIHDSLCWWMTCPQCGNKTCGVYDRQSSMGKIITGEYDRDINRRVVIGLAVVLAIVVVIGVLFAVN